MVDRDHLVGNIESNQNNAKSSGSTSTSDITSPQPRGVRAVWQRPVVRFVATLGIVLGFFYGVMLLPFFSERVFPAYLEFNARVTARLLTWFGDPAVADGVRVNATRFSLEIRRGCDALEPMALFLAAIIALETPLRPKVLGALLGIGAMLIVNFGRIVSLYYTGVHWRGAFETMHVDVWQNAFIVITVVFWTIWALWATKPRTTSTHVAAA